MPIYTYSIYSDIYRYIRHIGLDIYRYIYRYIPIYTYSIWTEEDMRTLRTASRPSYIRPRYKPIYTDMRKASRPWSAPLTERESDTGASLSLGAGIEA